jgi:hypothetical protein
MIDETSTPSDARAWKRLRERPRLIATTATGPIYRLNRNARVYPLRSGLGLLQELALRARDGESAVVSTIARRVSGEAAADAADDASFGFALGLVNATPAQARSILRQIIRAARTARSIEGLETLTAATLNAAWPVMRNSELTSALRWFQDQVAASSAPKERVVRVVDPHHSRFTLTTIGALSDVDVASWLAEVNTIPEGWRTGEGLPGAPEGGFGRQLPGDFGSTDDPFGDLGIGRGPGSGNGMFGEGGLYGDAPFGSQGSGSGGSPFDEGGRGGLFGEGGLFGNTPWGGADDPFSGALAGLGLGGGPGSGMPGSPFGEDPLAGSPGDEDIAHGNRLKNNGEMVSDIGKYGGAIAAGGAPSPWFKAAGVAAGLGLILLGADTKQRGQDLINRGEARNRDAAAAAAVVVTYEVDDEGVMRDKDGTVVVDAAGNVKQPDGTWKDKDGKPIPDPTKPGQLPDGDGSGGGDPTTLPGEDGKGGGNPVWLPDYDGEDGGNPLFLPDRDDEGGGNPLTLWDENGGGGQPTTIGVGVQITTVEGAGLRAGIVQTGRRTFHF